STQSIVLLCRHFDRELGKMLAYVVVRGSTGAVQLNTLGDFDQLRQDDFAAANGLANAEALMHQGRNQHLPSLIQRSQQVFLGNAYLLEENLVEFSIPADLAQGLYGHARTMHIHQQSTEPAMFGH